MPYQQIKEKHTVVRPNSLWNICHKYWIIVCCILCAISAVFAWATGNELHRHWALLALIGYIGAAGFFSIKRAVVACIWALAWTLVFPLAWFIPRGARQPEVFVVERAAHDFFTTANPWITHPKVVDDFNPYSPAMVLFGMPAQVWDTRFLGDARIWFLVFFSWCFIYAYRVTEDHIRNTKPYAQTTALMIVLCIPVVALSAAVGGVDLPVAGATMVALATFWAQKYAQSGAFIALALGMKWMIMPILFVLIFLLGSRAHKRQLLHFFGTSMGIGLLVHIPALMNMHEFINHTVLFPAGKAQVMTPAGNSLAGALLADVPGGQLLCYGLLLIAGIGFAVRLWIRPPRSLAGVCILCSIGLVVLFLFSPSFRFGYMLYPATFMWFAWITHIRRGVVSSP
ncbi:DUF2029 domain-containing protein [Corynebacterium sp. sy039]|nr:DUF2029 domain-containing protein [Corynebacterium sp. sy039]